jgi:NAD(P)-dependent dehydrogenase (short-subunit alcohol dehydrogenase family)
VSGTFAIYPSLRDRVVLVTGGASGIGAEIVQAFHGQGARIAFIDIADEQGRALSAALPGSLFLSCDITQTEALKKAITEVEIALGPIGVLVNNAANDDRKSAGEIDERYWDWSMDVNLKHQFFAAQTVMPQMRKLGGGSIVNFSSIAWHFGPEALTAYAAAKAGIIGLTKSLARSFGEHNIRVNAVEPGAVMTQKQRKAWYPDQKSVDAMVERQKIKRMLTGDEVARAVLFLASDDSRMITGQTLVVDAGMS